METTIPALPAGTTPCTRCEGLGVIGVLDTTRQCPRCKGRRYEPRPRPHPLPPHEAEPYLAELRALGSDLTAWRFDKTDAGHDARTAIYDTVRRIADDVAGRIPISGPGGMAEALGVSAQQFNNIQAGDPTGKRR